MAATLRVHTLAKDLGVPSKVILEKCRAEGVELKNHMAVVSVGLAESIREWFSEGADITSVEVADPIDVTKVRRPRKKAVPPPEPVEAEPAALPAEAPEAPSEAPSIAAQEAALPAEIPSAVEPEAPVAEPVAEPAEAVSAEAESAPEAERVEEEPAEALPPAETQIAAGPAEEPGEPAAPAVQTPGPAAEPPREPVRPAGPQLVPKPAELKGPRVVRIEAPEPDRPRPRPRAVPAVARGDVDESTTTISPRRGRAKGARKAEEEGAKARSRSPRRRPGGATDVDQRVREWRDQDLIERKERLASVTGHGLRERRAAERRRQQTVHTGVATTARKEPITISAPISLKDFSAAVGVPFAALAKKLVEQTGRLWTINQSIDAEQAELLAMELGVAVQIERAKTAHERLQDEFRQRERPKVEPRPPVVAMLGHVDHGKTSLLDAIRKTRVVAGEAGGITQHIGAYRLDRGDWHVTFVDTPGHEAFTAMRARGATLTDVVVLVVAADDGVMPQTIEAINHAKAAGVQIVVALNKIDLPGIDLDRIYGQLAEQGLVPSEWGGETDVIKTSATSSQGIDELVAHLSTLSELLELKADATVPAYATVIEAQMKEGRGVTAQVLVREGTLRPGQIVVCGPGAGRIRALRDDRGQNLKEAVPGTPVEVTGLDAMPSSGDTLYQVDDLSTAKSIAEEVRDRRRQAELEAGTKATSLESLLAGGADAETPELNVIVKADAQGSVEVLRKSLDEFSGTEARLTVLHAAVGAITEADVQLAKASGAMVIGFHVVAEERARQLAEQLAVEVRTYRVIYEILDDLHKALSGLLEPELKEEIRGAAEVRQIFNVTRVGTIAGCYVTDGVISRHHKARLIRDGRVVVEGVGLDSLKRFKDDAREVRAGFECGIKLHDYDDVKPGDVIQAFETVELARSL